jgi:hypothetical protein
MARRDLHFDTLSDAVAECQRLLESGYIRTGKWSLGQACRHIRLTVDASIDGYPKWMSIAAPVRPVLRWLLLPRFLRGDSPAGIKTAAMFVPPENLDDSDEVAQFADSVTRFTGHDGYLYPHPGFGKLDPELLERFHAAHAAHHLSFLGNRM